jgi:hypothetical protein
MKKKRIYFRKMRNAMLIEGKSDSGKVINLCTLGTAEKHLAKLLSPEWFFTQEKMQEITKKLQSVGYQREKMDKTTPNIRTINITRTPKIHAETGNQAQDIQEIPDRKDGNANNFGATLPDAKTLSER